MDIQKFNPFAKPSADMLALVELEEARRQLLASQSALEYAQSMVQYNTRRVERLSRQVKESSNV